MIKAYIEEYYNDYFKKQHVMEFPNLSNLADWIFGQMRTDYSGDSLAMGIPTPEKAERIKADAPWRIEFKPERGGPSFWIHQMKENGRIIFTDGTYTNGQRHWSQAAKEWCIDIEKRRKNPTFDFAE